jgi:transposase InsO family protein
MKSAVLHIVYLLVLILKALRPGGDKAIIALTFGIETNKDIVRRMLANHHKPKPGSTQDSSWLSLLGHSKDSLWSIDLFRCESLTVKSYWILVVMDQWSRRIIGFGIHRGEVDGIAACRMFNHAISATDPPRYLSGDNDPLFRIHRWRANLRFQDIHQTSTANEPTTHSSKSTTMVGNNIAVDYFRRQFMRDYQFAMHTLRARVELRHTSSSKAEH